MAVRFDPGGGGLQSYDPTRTDIMLPGSGGGRGQSIDIEKERAAAERIRASQAAAESQRQENLGKTIEKERSSQQFELRKGYRESLRDIKDVGERQERLNQLQQDIARVNVEAQQRKLSEGLITGYTTTTGGYVEAGKYVPRKEEKITSISQTQIPQTAVVKSEKYLGFIESTSPIGKIITGTKERYESSTSKKIIEDIKGEIKGLKKDEQKMSVGIEGFNIPVKSEFEKQVGITIEKPKEKVFTGTVIEPYTTKTKIENLYFGAKEKVRSLFLKPEESMEDVGGVRGVVGLSSLRIKEGLTYIGGKPGEAIGDLYPSTTETKTISGEYTIPTKSTIVSEGSFDPFKFKYEYETTSTSDIIKKAGQIGAGIAWYLQPTPLLIAQESSILTAPRKTQITLRQRVEAGLGLGFGIYRGAKSIYRTIPRKKLYGMSIERYQQYQRNLLKSQEMLSFAEREKARIIKQKLATLQGLDKGAARLKAAGLDIKATSAYQEAIKPTAWTYMGIGSEKLGKKQLTEFADDLVNQGVYKTREQAIKAIQDSGTYRMPFETQRVTDLKLVSGITESGKPAWVRKVTLPKAPVGYEDIGVIKTNIYGLEAIEKTKGVTRGIGFQWQEGAGGKIINKRLITVAGKKDLVRFSVYERGRISYKYVPIKAGPIKITTYPYARKVEEQLVKTKITGVKKTGPYIFREYKPEYRLVYGKSQRVSPLEFMDDLARAPPTKKEWIKAFKTDKEFVEDIIIKGKPELKFDIAGKAKVTKEGMTGIIGAQAYVEKPYKQFATGISDRGIIRVTTVPTDIGFKQFIGGGKKSSQQYIQSLYQETPTIVTPKPSPKISIPRVKITPPSPSLTSQELAPRMVGGLGYGVSKYVGPYYAPEGELVYTGTTIPPVVIGGDLSEVRVGTGIDVGTDIKTGLDIKQETGLDIGMDIKTTQIFRQPVRTQIKVLEKVKQLQEQEQKQVQKLIQPLKSLQKEKQIQRQVLKLREVLKTVQRPKTKPIPKVPDIIIPTLGLGKAIEKVKGMKQGEFEVFVKEFGKDVSIGLFPTKERAKEELIGKLKSTLRAGGYVTQEGKKLKFGELGILGGEFRPGKKDIFRVIQRKERRLGMKGETTELQFFRKKPSKSKRRKSPFGL